MDPPTNSQFFVRGEYNSLSSGSAPVPCSLMKSEKPQAGHEGKDVPYPANTPQYSKFWRLIKVDGKTRDEALEVMKTWVPRGKNGYRKPVAIVEEKKETEKRQATPTTSIYPTGPALDPAPPPPAQLTLEQKQGDRIVTLLVEIARALNRIADHMDPKLWGRGIEEG